MTIVHCKKWEAMQFAAVTTVGSYLATLTLRIAFYALTWCIFQVFLGLLGRLRHSAA